jgi:hypothetical protein
MNLPCSFISAALNKVETILELVLKGASLIKNFRRSLSFVTELIPLRFVLSLPT